VDTLGEHLNVNGNEASVPSWESSEISDDSIGTVVGVLDKGVVKVVAPSDALYFIYKENMAGLQNDVVDIAERIG
jgi:hypothetical protein